MYKQRYIWHCVRRRKVGKITICVGWDSHYIYVILYVKKICLYFCIVLYFCNTRRLHKNIILYNI